MFLSCPWRYVLVTICFLIACDPSDLIDRIDAGATGVTEGGAAGATSDAAGATPPPEQDPVPPYTMGGPDSGSPALPGNDVDAAVELPPPESDGGLGGDAQSEASLPLPTDAGPQSSPDTGLRDETDSGALCADGFPQGVAKPQTRLVRAMNPGPEGVGVCADGGVLASAGEVLWQVPIDGGTPTALARWSGRSLEMIQCDAAGRIFVADISPMFDLFALKPRRFEPAVLLLRPDASSPEQLLPPEADREQLTGFNGLLAIPDLGIFTSDMLAGVIVRYRENAAGKFDARVVVRDLMGANGIAYDARRRVLYVAVTGMLLTPDRVVAFELRADGELGPLREVWRSQDLHGTDGLAIDEHGVLYRADQLHGTVVRMSDDTVVARVPNPASLAFRGGTLYITDFKMLGALQNGGAGGVYAVDLGVCGGPLRP